MRVIDLLRFVYIVAYSNLDTALLCTVLELFEVFLATTACRVDLMIVVRSLDLVQFVAHATKLVFLSSSIDPRSMLVFVYMSHVIDKKWSLRRVSPYRIETSPRYIRGVPNHVLCVSLLRQRRDTPFPSYPERRAICRVQHAMWIRDIASLELANLLLFNNEAKMFC